MTDQRTFSDEELTAFLDGEHQHCDADAISEQLQRDPALKKRIAGLELDVQSLANAFGPLAENAKSVPVSLQEYSANKRTSDGFGWSSMAAAVVVSLGLGIGISQFGLSSPETKGWRQYVAAYQFLYGNSTLAHLKSDVATANKELARVTASIGQNWQVEDLAISSQVTYKRAQTLSFNGKPLVQLAFLSDAGAPIALCIIKSKKSGDTDITSGPLEDLSASHWRKDGYEFLLIGGQNQVAISELAKQYREKL